MRDTRDSGECSFKSIIAPNEQKNVLKEIITSKMTHLQINDDGMESIMARNKKKQINKKIDYQ